MARLAKVSQPLFGGDLTAADQEIAVFGTMKTANPVYTVDMPTLMASTAYAGGWSDAVEVGYAPFMEEMNGIQYGFSYQLSYIMQEGIPEWDANTTYYKGCIAKLVSGSGFKLYNSIVDNNTGNLLTDTTKWELVLDSTATLTKNRALVSSNSGKVAVATTTSTELGYVHGVTSNIQTQLNGKAGASTNNTFTGTNAFTQSPTMPTPSSSDNSTKGATTAFVKRAVSSATVFPDYANAYDLTKENGTIPANGWILCRSTIYTNIILDGLQIDIGYASVFGGTIQLKVKKGTPFSSTYWGTMSVFKFIPERN